MSDTIEAALRAQLRHTLDSTPWTTIGGKQLERYDGKVRDCFIDRDKGERIIVVTDRLSAFDAVVGTIPSKGQVLNQLATFWFDKTKDIAPNHGVERAQPIGDDDDPLTLVAIDEAVSNLAVIALEVLAADRGPRRGLEGVAELGAQCCLDAVVHGRAPSARSRMCGA